MAGYSGTPLERKLGVQPEHVVFLDGAAPAGLDLEAPTTHRLPKRLDLTLTFHTRRATLQKRLPTLIERTEQAGMIWICWPKKAAKVPTDLDDNTVREIGLATGWVDVKVCAIDEHLVGPEVRTPPRRPPVTPSRPV